VTSFSVHREIKQKSLSGTLAIRNHGKEMQLNHIAINKEHWCTRFLTNTNVLNDTLYIWDNR